MDQHNIGIFLAAKRREKNLTQEQPAERLGVSNKTISKWENGKCMPDYSVNELLCKELRCVSFLAFLNLIYILR